MDAGKINKNNKLKKLLFYFIMLTSVALLTEILFFTAFYVFERKVFSFSRISTERKRLFQDADNQKSASGEVIQYDFLNDLENANIIIQDGNSAKVTKGNFTINENKRTVLFEYPNSEVVFHDVFINENAKLTFGIGINQGAWDKPGDGVLFETRVVDKKSGISHVIFSRYIDPKNNAEDRKWVDEQIDLNVFSGENVSFIFQTTSGPTGNTEDDWAGWSNPRLIATGREKKTISHPSIEVIHPYLGFVYNPEWNMLAKGIALNPEINSGIPVSAYGFGDVTSPFHSKSSDKIIVGVFGGSVAFWFSVWGVDSFIHELKRSPMFFNKEIVIVRVALGGYKQPQQLIALNYLLSLGADFDIIINLDGFNEVALPPAENIPKSVFPFFPRNWSLRVQDLPDPVAQSLVGEITFLKSKRSKWAWAFSKAPFRYSITANLIWKAYDRYLQSAISKDRLAVNNYKPQEGHYVTTGPPYHYENETDLFKDLASVWQRSSLQMAKLCSANGIKYFHFLQPNQYLAGSKRLAEEELKYAFLDTHPYKIGVKKGYPHLIEMGKELALKGVNFHDLSMVFADRLEPIYIDDCCHYNQTGNEILGRVIGQTIAKELNANTALKDK